MNNLFSLATNIKISIITATFNCESTIEDTILSVLNQTHKNIEYIIIDGKSTDNTLKIIEKYKNNISKIISENDNGIYDALNKGIANASGNIIGFVHADDIFANNEVLEKICLAFAEKNIDAIYGDLQYVAKENTEKIIRNWKSEQFEIKNIKKGWMPPHPTFYVKKEIYNNFGNFDTKYKISADYDLMMRFLWKHKISISYIPEVLVKMRVGGKSNSNFKNILQKMKEDYSTIRINKIGGFFTIFYKNISKIPQFFKH